MYKSEPGMWKIYREIRDINEEEEQALKNGGRRPPRKAEQGRTPNRTASTPPTTYLHVLLPTFHHIAVPRVPWGTVVQVYSQSITDRVIWDLFCAAEHKGGGELVNRYQC